MTEYHCTTCKHPFTQHGKLVITNSGEYYYTGEDCRRDGCVCTKYVNRNR